MEMTMAVMSVAPVGVFCLIAKTFSETGFDAFLPDVKVYALCYSCTGSTVFRHISDITVSIYQTKSGKIYQKILPGHDVCVFNINIQYNHSAVH